MLFSISHNPSPLRFGFSRQNRKFPNKSGSQDPRSPAQSVVFVSSSQTPFFSKSMLQASGISLEQSKPSYLPAKKDILLQSNIHQAEL